MATATPGVATCHTAALRTLESIQQYVIPARFSLSSLARGLMRMGQSEVLLAELTWLVAHGYLEKDVSAVYDITLKGRMYEGPQPEHAPEEQPMFDFLSVGPAPVPPAPDPRSRRR